MLRAGLGTKLAKIESVDRTRLVVDADGSRILVVTRRWRQPLPTSFLRHQIDAARGAQEEIGADNAVIVLPDGFSTLVANPAVAEDLRSRAAPIELLSIDELVAKLADQWPARAS